MKSAGKYRLVAACIALMLLATGCRQQTISVKEHLDTVIVTLDEVQITLGELAYYIYAMERVVEEQAVLYAPDDPESYWNAHVNGVFIKLGAKEGVIQAAIRDRLLSQMAAEEGITITPEEKILLDESARQEYDAMSDYQREETGIDEKAIKETFYKAGMAEKYAKTLMVREGLSEEEIAVEGGYYQSLLAEHAVRIDEKAWDKVEFGKVTIKR